MNHRFRVLWATAGLVMAALILGAWVVRARLYPGIPESDTGLAVESGAKANRLIREKSPYLLQHATNPVDWYPWGEEAFAKSRDENKPIFLSVGYSTCHWCHVMERESFENPEIAAVLNQHFVAIKVDREERPDVDRVYMTYVQAATGSGGWPMSVWLTPDLKPFHGGTYFPPDDRWGRPGFRSVLERIAQLWKSDPSQIAASAEQVTRQLEEISSPGAATTGSPDSALLTRAYEQIKASYDPRYGGFGGAPKFPRPVNLVFLFRYYDRTASSEARDMALFTLRQMAQGGVYDHLGGGFHRYSVDVSWHVPHFEKMLYDQAQLVISYLEAYQITKDEFFALVARDILDYVMESMTGTDGQLFSAEDADSPIPGDPERHAEGAFYVWPIRELYEALGADTADLLAYYYGVKEAGNAPSDPHGEFAGKNILMVNHTVDEAARQFGRSVADTRTLLDLGRRKLKDVRARRPRPHLDDKTLTAWNGLMISALARASQVLEDDRYLRAANRAADFVGRHLYDRSTGELRRRYRDGESAIPAFVDDYAFLIQGLLDLYEASFDVSRLGWALDLQNRQNALFWDDQAGGFFNTTDSDSTILLRMKDDHDGAEPAPNSVAVLNLLRLSQSLDRAEYRLQAERTLRAFADRLGRTPSSMPMMLIGLDGLTSKPRQIVIAGLPDAPDTKAMLREVHRRFIPNKVLLLADGGAGQQELARHLDFFKNIQMVEGRATAFVCENFVCKTPTCSPDTLALQLFGGLGRDGA